jgi:phosphatidylinositol glycan class B
MAPSADASLLALYGAAAALRLLSVWTIRTYAAPDEHWQAPELAHKLVFGTGYV